MLQVHILRTSETNITAPTNHFVFLKPNPDAIRHLPWLPASTLHQGCMGQKTTTTTFHDDNYTPYKINDKEEGRDQR